MYERQLAIRDAEDEMRFNRLVSDVNLSLDDQLSYRTQQLKRATDNPFERKRISGEILNLKERVEQKKYSDAYTDKLISYESGIASVDSIINWLNDRISATTNESVKSSIRQSLIEKQKEKFILVQKLIKDRTEYAIKDKTEFVLNNQIFKVNSLKNEAILNGNPELADIYDLQVRTLEKAKTESSAETSVKDFAVSTITGFSSASNLLDSYNSKIFSASTNTPVTIAGVTYVSEREYWTYRRDSYIADISSAGFLTRFNDEQNSNIKVKNSQGLLTNNDITVLSSAYNSLIGRPELQPYLNNVNIHKQDSLQTAADLLAGKIYNQYLTNYDINRALNSLENIKTFGGVDTREIYTKLLTKNAEIKAQEVSGITVRADVLTQEGVEPTKAVTQAVKEGYGMVVTPQQAAVQTAEQISQRLVRAKEQQTAVPSETTTIQQPAVPFETTTVQQPAVPSETTTIQQPAQQPAAAPQPTPQIFINKQLDFGVTDPQVKTLQQFLNKQGFAVSEAGKPGSAGFETEYFGPATQAALQKFQSAQGIVSSGTAATTGYGRLGPQTLTVIQKLFK